VPKALPILRHLPVAHHKASCGNPLFSVDLNRQQKCTVQIEGVTEMTESAKNTQDTRKDAADLYWLAFLLTGRQDLSIDIAAETAVSSDDATPVFTAWMRGWQRRLVIGRSLTAIHDELADSARQTQLARGTSFARGSAAPQRKWSLSPDTTKADLEQALLAIDLFPRAALLLLGFEGIRMADAAVLLDADPTLIRKAQAIGLRELTANLADQNSHEDRRGNKPVTQAPTKLCSWLRITAVCH
jgi:DNA-directed RNA polymerase specialized sigma24 family protein